MVVRIARFLVVLVICGSSRADESQQGTAALHAAYYGFAVCEYCGLVDFKVHDGFRREIAYLIEREGVSEKAARKVRIRDFFDDDVNEGKGTRRRLELESKLRSLAAALPDDDLELACHQVEALAKRALKKAGE